MNLILNNLRAAMAMSPLMMGCVMPGIAAAQQSGGEEIRKAQSTPAAARTAATAAASSESNYRVRANDIIEVKVFQEDDLSGKVRVREDGTVRLPLINDTVAVGGLSVTAVENKIRELLAKDYVRDPRVTVNVAEFSKTTITVMGQVNRGGAYSLANNKPVTLLQAIGTAGGYTRLANPKKVFLKRITNGQEQVYTIDARAMARDPQSATIYLKDGDVIDVKEAGF
jgi:polysaccharide export outer membrane protein